MDWYHNRSKRSSVTTGQPTYPSPAFHGTIMTNNNNNNSTSLSANTSQSTTNSSANTVAYQSPLFGSSKVNLQAVPPPLNLSGQPNAGRNLSPISHQSNSPLVATTPLERNSYYFSQFPLFASDWVYLNNSQLDCIALGSYKEGFTNKLEIVHGCNYENEFSMMDNVNSSPGGSSTLMFTGGNYYDEEDNESVDGFYFQKVCEANLDYPITHLQWDPSMMQYGGSTGERLAASSEVLRLYKVAENGDSYTLQQTHVLANNTAGCSTTSSNSNNSSSSGSIKTVEDINTYPPVTSFDWNKTDPNILITSSVDTTCTVWDLHRSHGRNSGAVGSNDDMSETATIKTQLIAHDSEVFDVKFIHKSTNVFASVGNDGSMRVFDLRSLEHSTIIYEPPPTLSTMPTPVGGNPHSSTFNSKALLTLTTSNIDQHHLATVGINSNQIIIIDMRMPGLPVVTIDGSLGGINHSSINSIKWHPTSNYLLSGGDDCQALVWDINNIPSSNGSNNSTTGSNGNGGGGNNHTGAIIDTPVLAYTEDLEVNNVTWRQNKGDWMGVVSGKGFQAVSI
ncbi:hypothetical protein SBY92_004811 [Candida maltosa Xu316]